jgi:hypothetical protein
MRTSALSIGVLLALAGAASAGPRRVVVVSEPAQADELRAALQLSLGGGTLVVDDLAPPAGLRLERAAAVQRIALADDAEAGVWIEQSADGADVCVVSRDGRYFRQAPLQGELQPRVFAAIATSLLDELLAPPDAINVKVDVHVDVNGQHVDAPGFVAPEPAVKIGPYPPIDGAIAPPSLVVTGERRRVRADRTLVEIGPMLSPVTAGIEAELAFPMTPSLRFGVLGMIDMPFDTQYGPLFAGAGELRHVGDGVRRHFDYGLLAGVVAGGGEDPMPMAGARLGLAWEGPRSGMSLSLVPVLLLTGTDGPVPGVYASMRWELPI